MHSVAETPRTMRASAVVRSASLAVGTALDVVAGHSTATPPTTGSIAEAADLARAVDRVDQAVLDAPVPAVVPVEQRRRLDPAGLVGRGGTR